MKSVEISGVAKVEGYKGNTYSSVKINGMRLEELIADELLKEDNSEMADLGKTSICRVTIVIEPYLHTLEVNGVPMQLEL